MNNIKLIALPVLACGLGLGSLLFCARAVAAEPDSSIPPVIRAGFEFFQKQRPEQGVEAWKVGGLAGEEFRSASRGGIFREAERAMGKYVSYEWVATKMVGKSSRIIYLAVNYERGAVYGRFLVYRADKDWVVQSMNFNTRPEALMPWLAFEEEQ